MLLLRRIGYSSVVETTYEEGIDPDNEMRRAYSFYVEAVKYRTNAQRLMLFCAL